VRDIQAVIVRKDKDLYGIITPTELINNVVLAGKKLSETTCETAANDICTIKANFHVSAAMKRMVADDLTELAVIPEIDQAKGETRKVLGVLTGMDLMRYYQHCIQTVQY
jgi:signal-transduction protein with cAMP-binding, CBS, and nucleotidyltransferase domain